MKVSGVMAMLKNRAQREELYSTEHYWDAKARQLGGDAVSMWPNNHLNRLYHAERMAIIGKSLPARVECDVLDVGCGTGLLSRMLAERGARVTGIDFSSESIRLARTHSVDAAVHYRVQSVFDLDEVATYDMVLSWGCLTVACKNRGELVVALRNLRRALRRGGQVLLLEPIHRGFLHRVLNVDVDTFCGAMREAGFAVQGVDEMHFWPMRLALAFLSWPQSVTQVGYRLGQQLMQLDALHKLGDYKAVHAVGV